MAIGGLGTTIVAQFDGGLAKIVLRSMRVRGQNNGLASGCHRTGTVFKLAQGQRQGLPCRSEGRCLRGNCLQQVARGIRPGLKQQQCQIVTRLGVIRLQGQRLAVMRLSILSRPCRCQRPAQIVMNMRLPRVQAQRLPELVDGLRQAPHAAQGNALDLQDIRMTSKGPPKGIKLPDRG